MAEDYTAFRPSKIWKRMNPERRLEAAELFWTDEQATEQQVEAISAIAARMKFRTKTLFSLPLDRKAKYLATLPIMPDTIAARALVNYHLERQRPMMAAFLDSLGISHENGLISDENVTKPDAARLRAAGEDLVRAFPPEDAALYFSTLISQDPDTWGALSESAAIASHPAS